jgi:hypothetical protein
MPPPQRTRSKPALARTASIHRLETVAIVGDVGEPEGIIEFTVGEQTTVGRDLGAVEFELDSAVEGGPQKRLLGFTRRVPHNRAPSLSPTP